MKSNTIDDAVKKIEIGSIDSNDIILLCSGFAESHGFSLRTEEAAKIRAAGVDEIKSKSGFKYFIVGGHELALRVEKSTLYISYNCDRGSIKPFDAYLDQYKIIAKTHKDHLERMNSNHLI